MKRRAILALLPAGAMLALAARADEALWAQLRAGGQVVLVRHAVTDPGVGDPPGFRLDACGTQRNLSETGRREAQRLGEVLRTRQVPVGDLLTSPWCRCRETARLVFGREGRADAALGNLFGRREEEAAQLPALRKLVRRPASGNLFLVTHGSTIYALTGVSPGTAEMVVLTPQEGGAFRVAGRIGLA
jgi:broad specificity phosphatase PhoE